MLLKIEHVCAYMIQIVCTASGRSHLHRSFATVARRYWYLEKIYEEADEASREPMRNNREKLLSFVEETKLSDLCPPLFRRFLNILKITTLPRILLESLCTARIICRF